MWRTMRLIAALICLAAALWIVLAAGLPDRTGGSQTLVAPEIGAQAPPITASDLSGNPVSLTALRGTPVILNFWATWCGPCITEMPMIQSAYETYQQTGLRILAINANEPVNRVLAWKTDHRLTFDFLIDHGQISDQYEVRGLPSTYFISRTGQITHITYGPLTASELDAAIHDLLAG